MCVTEKEVEGYEMARGRRGCEERMGKKRKGVVLARREPDQSNRERGEGMDRMFK